MLEITEVFPAGPILTETQQIGRGPVLDALEQRVNDAEKIKLFATRRTGKTSAATAVVQRLVARSEPVAVVDLSRLVTSTEVANRLATEFAPGLARLNRAKRASGWLTRLFGDSQDAQERLLAQIAASLAGDVLSPGAGAPALLRGHGRSNRRSAD